MFDKVIIACLFNPEKEEFNADLPSNFRLTHQVSYYGGMLTDYVKFLGYPVTIVKGLRDVKDFEYEERQLRYLQDINKDINVCYIMCDKEYTHVSSSGIKILELFKGKHPYRIV
jgi:phosphopantetheine adenylyltransferase